MTLNNGTAIRIPFNRPYVTGNEINYVSESIKRSHLSGNGFFTKKCQAWLNEHMGSKSAMLVHSGTAALELAALLVDIKPGDEVIMPSFTFVSTANAFVLRGAVPVFVDIRADVPNLDESLVEQAITDRTKAICPVHYGGIGCDMKSLGEIARQYNLTVIEDAAQGFGAAYKKRALGTIGALGALSFHDTKNVMCGEGGALLINDERLIERAEILLEKGTDRRKFLHGLVDKYSWQDVGSSFLPSEIEAAFLWAQFEQAEFITSARLEIWDSYRELLKPLTTEGVIRIAEVPEECDFNAHCFYILVNDAKVRNALLEHLNGIGINAIFHYIPLHTSPAGRRFGRCHGSLDNTELVSACLLRLPLWVGMTSANLFDVVEPIFSFFGLAFKKPESQMINRDSESRNLAC